MHPSTFISRCCTRNISKFPASRAARLTSASSLDHRARITTPLLPLSQINPNSRHKSNMSFSNADTGSKAADPYTQKNLNEPSLKEKIEDLMTFVDKHKFCMMTTRTENGLLASRCMALAGKEANGLDLIFHTNTESGKTDDLDAHSDINLAFLTPAGEWASISGKASIETDRAIVKKFYSPALKAWIGDLGDGTHDGGPEDPRIGVIRVKAVTAQYAISNRTAVGGFVEFAKGVATGEAPNVNKLRRVSEAEVQQWRSTA